MSVYVRLGADMTITHHEHTRPTDTTHPARAPHTGHPPGRAPTNTPDTAASTEHLLARASRGEHRAWQQIIHRYSPIVTGKVRSFRLQDADAHDATQMTWLRLAENLHRIHRPERLAGWLATTATRECLHILRQNKRTIPTHEPPQENTTNTTTNPEQHTLHTETLHTLHTLITALPPHQRTLLHALFTDNPRPYTEIAHTLGIPIGGIGPTRARALQQLRQGLNQHGLGPKNNQP
jgi:RNA polymerase sigma factor (sigma-70 family)